MAAIPSAVLHLLSESQVAPHLISASRPDSNLLGPSCGLVVTLRLSDAALISPSNALPCRTAMWHSRNTASTQNRRKVMLTTNQVLAMASRPASPSLIMYFSASSFLPTWSIDAITVIMAV